MPGSRVFALRTRPEAVGQDLRQLCDRAGLPHVLDRATPALIIPRRARFPRPGTQSPPWQIEAVILALRGAGLDRIAAAWTGAPPPPEDPARRVQRALDVPDVGAARMAYRPLSRLHALPRGFPDGITLRAGAASSQLVPLTVLAPHPQLALGGAMHALAHALLGEHLGYVEPWLARAAVDALAISTELSASRFAVLDGVAAPIDGARAATPGFLLASTDLVSLDAVAASLAGYDPLRLEHLRLAHDDRLGVADPRDIELVGDDLSFARGSPRAWRPAPRSTRRAATARALAHTPLPRWARALAMRATRLRDDPATLATRWAETAWGACYERYAHTPLRPPTD